MRVIGRFLAGLTCQRIYTLHMRPSLVKHAHLSTIVQAAVLGLMLAAPSQGSSLIPSGVCRAVGTTQPEDDAQARHDELWRDFQGVRAVTKPSQDAMMGFTLSTRVVEVLVEGGQQVHQGDLLVQGDDSSDKAEAAFQRARAETELPRKRAEGQAELAKLEYQRQLQAKEKGGANPLDIERARAAEQAARIDYQLAILNEVLAKHQADAAEARVAKLSLRAPFDGVVDVVRVNKGQSVRDGEPVVRVVAIDPIWIDVPAPTALTIKLDLKTGSPAWVMLQDDVKPRIYTAKVIEVAPTADPASGTRRVRVEMANKIHLVPGMNAQVRFTPPSESMQPYIVDPAKPISSSAQADYTDTQAIVEAQR